MDFPRKGKPNMKKLLFAVTALAALSLLAPSTGFAAGALNQLGFYTDVDMTDVNMSAGLYTSQDVYLVLSNPYNHDLDSAVTAINGVEFTIVYDSAQLNATPFVFATPAVNVGSGNIYIAGFGTPLPVGEGGYVSLGTASFFVLTTDPAFIYLAPSEPVTNPGNMAYLDFNQETVGTNMYPSSGDYANPVFSFNGGVVATENASMDQIKAMFR